MKKYLLVALLLLASNVSYAKIGRHNLQVNVGGGMSSLITIPVSFTSTPAPTEFNAGGGFTIELGYLFHSVRESGLVHGFDVRADFTMGFTSGDTELLLFVPGSGYSIVTGNKKTQSLLGGLAMTYTLGRQLKSGRLMFDVMGYGMAYGSASSTSTYKELTAPTIKVSGLAMQYVLPGVQYMMNNGLTIGWRNKLKVNLGELGGTGQLGFDTMISLGYTFGGGKQPWEN